LKERHYEHRGTDAPDKPFKAAEARKRQLASLKQGDKIPVCQNSDERDIDTKTELATLAGVSDDTIAKADYIRLKRQGARTDLTSDQNEQKLWASEQSAQEHGVSPTTIRHDGQFAAAVDKLGLQQTRNVQ